MSGRPRPGVPTEPRTRDDARRPVSPSRAQTVRTAALAVIATLLAVLVVNALTSGESDEDTADAAAPASGPLVPFAGEPAGSLGAAGAPVVMEVWSDFSCPYCGRFAVETQPLLVAQYVETGQVRLEFHDFPAQGQGSLDAAVAARAAGRQDAYVAYADRLYAAQSGFDRAGLLGHAEALGLDMARFEADLGDPTLEAAVRSDWLTGQQAGVRATPSFVIERTLLAGAQPVEQFGLFIDHFLTPSG